MELRASDVIVERLSAVMIADTKPLKTGFQKGFGEQRFHAHRKGGFGGG